MRTCAESAGATNRIQAASAAATPLAVVEGLQLFVFPPTVRVEPIMISLLLFIHANLDDCVLLAGRTRGIYDRRHWMGSMICGWLLSDLRRTSQGLGIVRLISASDLADRTP